MPTPPEGSTFFFVALVESGAIHINFGGRLVDDGAKEQINHGFITPHPHRACEF
jgi:hypothetical protein